MHSDISHTPLVHFLAFPTDPPRCAQREGQARVMQALIQAEIEAGNQVIAMGDLNDYDGSVLDANSDEPTSRVLSFLKAPGLNNIAADVSNAATRYSAWYACRSFPPGGRLHVTTELTP